MDIKEIDKYEDKVLTIIDKYEIKLNKFIESYKKFNLKVINITKALSDKYIEFFSSFAKFARYTTYPVHWILIYFDIRKMKPKTEELPIFETGAHYVYGKPGKGKSTLMYHAMMDYAYLTGKASLTTAQMELPRLSLSGAEYYLHQRFKPSDIFQDGEQIVQIDASRYNMIVYEEMLTQYNQRNNKESAYNNEVIPMIGALGTQRHQGIDLFYFISQLPKTDIQIMLMLTGYHEPRVKKGFDYKEWLETGKIRFVIKGWHVTSYSITPKGGMDYELTNKRKWFYPNTLLEDMKYFNRLNMQTEFKNKPKLQLETKL